MQPINLLSLSNAHDTLTADVFNEYIKFFGAEAKVSEFRGIKTLVNEIVSLERVAALHVLDGFYIGFTINQISKEFDLLRIGDETIVNIELKKENTGERMKKQLLKNRYYLNILGKVVHSFTYVTDDNKLYFLNQEEALVEIPISELFEKLLAQGNLVKIANIQSLFDPSNYLVSPFNSPNKFNEGHYFLTDHQDRIKETILGLASASGPNYVSIEGAAGTGKTLLTYDLAKVYREQGKKVLLFHVGGLNNGHRTLNENYGWEIVPIKEHASYNLNHYDVIIFDEAQRVWKHQLEVIISTLNAAYRMIIFSFDGDQCLQDIEINWNIPAYIRTLSPLHSYKLTDKIRTNKEIAFFIKNLFNRSKRNPTQSYSNVTVQYFSNVTKAKQYSRVLSEQGWKVINYTPSRYQVLPADKYSDLSYPTAHNVIGQEYDQVVAFIDKTFHYDSNGQLITSGFKPYYHPTKMLFQILTRTRKKLTIIIIDNEEILKTCLNIINGK